MFTLREPCIMIGVAGGVSKRITIAQTHTFGDEYSFYGAQRLTNQDDFVHNFLLLIICLIILYRIMKMLCGFFSDIFAFIFLQLVTPVFQLSASQNHQTTLLSVLLSIDDKRMWIPSNGTTVYQPIKWRENKVTEHRAKTVGIEKW